MVTSCTCVSCPDVQGLYPYLLLSSIRPVPTSLFREDSGPKITLFLCHKVVIGAHTLHIFNNMASQIFDLDISDPTIIPLELPAPMVPF